MLSASKSGSASGASSYNLTRSLRFRASASAYLNRTMTTPTNNLKWSWSGWAKRGLIGTVQDIFGSGDFSTTGTWITFNASDSMEIYYFSSSYIWRFITTQKFRDPAAYYHVVVAYDSTQATSTNRFGLYINGLQVTAFTTATYPALNQATNLNSSSFTHYFSDTTNKFDGYLTEVNFIDGQALTPSSFGSTNALTGVWQPARYTGTYGTNGFYLPFTDNSALTTSSNVGLGKDFSGNGNYWVTNNISITAGVTYDSMTDVPTLTSASAANTGVWNPIGNGSGTQTNGNLTDTTATTLPDVGTFAMQSGKWYWETTITTASNPRVGVYDIGSALPTAGGLGGTAFGWCILNGPSRTYTNNVTTAYGSFNGSSGDVVMIAYDASTGNLWFGANGTFFASGNPATGASPSLTGVTGKAIVPAVASGSGTNVFNGNFGQQPFTYTPPTGFVALNTYNLPTSTILAGNKVMDATLYTGTGANLTVTNAGAFKPDLVWAKSRSNAYYHHLVDSVRGVNRDLYSNDTLAEFNYSSGGSVTAFNSNGFSLGTQANEINTNAATFVAWQWQAGQGSTSSNTNGTITSTVSVNASAGFSVVTYTGTGANATVGHGLGVAPAFMIFKRRDSTSNWPSYHSSLGNTGGVYLNGTGAFAVSSAFWNNTSPTSSVFTLGGGNEVNTASATNVAYCWTPIAGYSAFGSYTGNGSTDGPFVYTGFRPKFVMVKRTDNVGDWWMYDTSRSTYNAAILYLFADTSAAEVSDATEAVDFLSNGFKLRVATYQPNTSGGTFIYMAFAENPFKNALAR